MSPSKWTPSSRSAPDPLDPGPAGFTHRGLHADCGAPENSLSAAGASIEIGAGIECDLRLTADGEAVVFHDRDALRLCDNPLEIGRSRWAELRHLRVGSEPIPTLADLLAMVRGQVPLLLEVKVEGDVRRWIPALKRDLAGYHGRVGVMSFDPRIARLLGIFMPQVRRGLVVRDTLAPALRLLAFRVAEPHFLAVDIAALGKPWVAQARRRMPVYAWTVRAADQLAQAKVHADALIWEGDGRPRT